MRIKNISYKGPVLEYGGMMDKTKVVSPHLIRLSDGKLRMYYVGTNCSSSERKGYRLLYADSVDGVNFKKTHTPLLSLQDVSDKHYSPCVIYSNNSYFLYYGLGSNGVYIIRSAMSTDGITFQETHKTIISNTTLHSAAVHSPKTFVDNKGTVHMYYTGSHTASKIYSKKYAQYDVASGFKLFYATSVDKEHFQLMGEVKINLPGMINFYGHNVLFIKNKLYLFFASFDSSINRIYFSFSDDFIHFSKPQLLLEPNGEKKEMGVYSCSVIQMHNDDFKIFYGVRYEDNHWNINAATFTILEL